AAVSDAVLCEEKLSLVDHARWTLVAPEDDPFDPPPAPDGGDGGGGTMSRPPCGEDDVHALTVGGEPALAVQTASCNWATVEQPSRVGVEAGEPLAYRVWYYSQDAFAGATEAETSVVLGDETIAQTTLALPSTGGLLYGTIAAPLDAPKGTRVLWNVHNKGSNEYDFIELSVTRRAPCPEVE
ncbi:MAG: hypothetical protein AABZ30_11060, partial [Myxococcota bacterium]